MAVIAFGLLGDPEQAWTEPDALLELIEVNYTAPAHLGVLLAARMRPQAHGRIVALSSVAGERVRRSNFVYGSTKAGLDGFYLGLGEALRDTGVAVLVARPGFVKSKMTDGLDEAPMAVTPDEVAEAVVQRTAAPARADLGARSDAGGHVGPAARPPRPVPQTAPLAGRQPAFLHQTRLPQHPSKEDFIRLRPFTLGSASWSSRLP